jgi:hypothetical protein
MSEREPPAVQVITSLCGAVGLMWMIAAMCLGSIHDGAGAGKARKRRLAHT